jgi:hypothetical protein
MKAKALNTTYDFEFYNGETVKMTLSFYNLYLLRGKDKKLYDKYSKIMTNGASDELEMITVLYAAYVCANLEETELLTEEEFMMMCGSDRKAVADAVKELTQPKKLTDSDNRLYKKQENVSEE